MISHLLVPFRALTHRRSNGVLVPRPVARIIRAGDRARGAGDWASAGEHYRRVLARAPGLAHIWIQAGHAAKETGDLSAAAQAYATAAAARPADAEPHVHLGHVAKLDGATAQAADHYLDAIRRAPDALAAASEFLRMVDGRSAHGRAQVEEAAGLLELPVALPDIADEAPAQDGVVFDVSDLLSYFSHARLPTGIQRVQIEIVAAALRRTDGPGIAVCCFSEPVGGWVALPGAQFTALAAMALASGDREDPAWRRAVIGAMLALATAPAIRFGPRATLVNLGASWAERNYFLHLRTARLSGGPFYVPLIHDVIPMRHPEWFPPALVRDFRAWIGAVAAHADGFLANSRATAADLARELGPCPAPIRVLPLDGDFGGRGQGAADAPGRLGLASRPFALMVSTIEPRKNHLGLFAAWTQLIEQLGEAGVPTLACVGGRGWMNDAVHAALARDPRLRRKVVLLHGVADADLAALYDACLFTVYPSLYEGWGLPITEALCHGKVPAISNTTAMPEAGGPFAVTFDPADPASIAATIAPLIVEPQTRAALERRIADAFVPRGWPAIAAALLDDVAQLIGGGDATPIALPATATGIVSLRADGHPFGEALREGTGWAPPGSAGSEILGRATLRLPADAAEPVALHLTARGGDKRRIRVSAGGRLFADSVIAGGGDQWLTLPVGVRHLELDATGVLLSDVAFGGEPA